MSEKSPYSITIENQDIIVRLDRDLLDRDSINKFLEYLELETIRKRSRLTQEQATILAEEIDFQVWSNLKHKFIGK